MGGERGAERVEPDKTIFSGLGSTFATL